MQPIIGPELITRPDNFPPVLTLYLLAKLHFSDNFPRLLLMTCYF